MPSVALTFPKRRSLSLLAACAVLLIVFSYLVALAVAAACVILPFLAVTYGFGGTQAMIVLVMGLILSGTIAWSLVPRRDHFAPSGLELDLSKQPRLLATVEEITSTLREKRPEVIYLTTDANAWVAERGGFLSFGASRRVMALGLPLLANVTVDELRAILAHECAHYYAGDTRLGPRLYAARIAMLRTLNNLSSDSALLQFMRKFGFAKLVHEIVSAGLAAHWKLFLRVTQFISRHQEYRSDELAAYICGAGAMIEVLEKVHSTGAIVNSFWRSAVNPALAAGFLPPLTESFRLYAALPAVEQARADFMAKLLDTPKTNPYDSHPPLKSRIERLRSTETYKVSEPNAAPATTLLDDIPELERRLMRAVVPALKDSP